jgi:hypothetical protein
LIVPSLYPCVLCLLQKRVTPNTQRVICNNHEGRFSALVTDSHIDEV